MPDWFYRTVAQPVLFRLPDRLSRAIALGILRPLGRHRAGRALIDFLGHMRPDLRHARNVAGCRFPSPFGLGWRVDPEERAAAALAQFGVGFIEVLQDEQRHVTRRPGAILADGPARPRTTRRPEEIAVPLLCRRIGPDGEETVELPSGVRLPVLHWASDPAETSAAGVVLQVGQRQPAGGWHVPASMPKALPDQVARWRRILADDTPVIVAGGVSQPGEARALHDAGASLVMLDAGFVFGGPGLVRRCNDALLARSTPTSPAPTEPPWRRAWVWALILGLALAAGGALTLGLALTRVLLPYDEHYLGLTTATLRETLPRLFAFMAHDRGTLAGTMLGLGWLYAWLAWHGVRQNEHGAKTTVAASALTGFASFFAFLGFGYLDTLHAFVAAVLFQITVQVLVGSPGGAAPHPLALDEEDRNWRRAQWGQFLWLLHAIGLLGAGAVILGIGMSSVFVTEDLEFLCLSRGEALAMGERVVSVVAHDRATLGGMLLASGVGMLLPVLWCYRRGSAWLWKAVAGLGTPAYAAAVGVHWWVGYTDWLHLAPAIAGAVLWITGLWASRAYLCATTPDPTKLATETARVVELTRPERPTRSRS